MRLKQIKGTAATEVDVSKDTLILFSYETPVAAFTSKEGFLRADQYYSKTTTKHINQFLKRHAAQDKNVRVVPQSHIDALLAEKK